MKKLLSQIVRYIEEMTQQALPQDESDVPT